MPAAEPDAISAIVPGGPEPAGLSPDEKQAWDQLVNFWLHGLGYAQEMAGRPQTLYALDDSPIGLASWMLDHDPASQAMIARVFAGGTEGLSMDDVLDNVDLYWFTKTAVSSARLYWESKLVVLRPEGRHAADRDQRLPGGDLHRSRELGAAGLSEPHPLQPAGEGRALRRLGAAGRVRERDARVVPLGALRRRMSELDEIKQIDAGVLNVGYVDAGPRTDRPCCCCTAGRTTSTLSPRWRRGSSAAGHRVIVPYLRGYGTTRFLRDDAVRNGEQAALAVDAIDLMDALGIPTAIVAGFDWGARTADMLAALWPERVAGLVSVSGYLIGSQAAEPRRCRRPPSSSWWYQYYFATERGRAGYAAEHPRLRAADLARRPRRGGTSTTPRSSAARRRSTTPTMSRSSSTTIAGGSAWPRARRSTRELEARLAPGSDDRGAHHHAGGRRERRAASRPGPVRGQVHRAVRASHGHRRHRAQPAAGGARRLRRGGARGGGGRRERGTAAELRRRDRVAQLGAR